MLCHTSLPVIVGGHALPHFFTFNVFYDVNGFWLSSHQAILSIGFPSVFPYLFPFYLCSCYKIFESVPSYVISKKPCLSCLDLIHNGCFSVNFHQKTLICTFGCPWNYLLPSKRPHFNCLKFFQQLHVVQNLILHCTLL